MINYSTVFSLLSEGIRIPDKRSCPLAGRYLRCFSDERKVGSSTVFYIRDFVMVNAPRTSIADKVEEVGCDIIGLFPGYIDVPATIKDKADYKRKVLEQLVEPYLQPFITKKRMDFGFDRMLMPALGQLRNCFSQVQKTILKDIWEGLKPAEISMLWWNNDFSRLMTSLDTDKALKTLLRQIERPGKLAQCPISQKKKIPAKAYLVLNVETTGREEQDQVLQITITDHKGNLLFNRFCQPSVSIQKQASDHHHMTKDIFTRATLMGNQSVTTWQDIYPEVVKHLSDRTVYAFNVTFDAQMVLNTCKAFNLDTDWMKTCHWVNMKLYMNSATRIGKELAGELVDEFEEIVIVSAQVIPFPVHRWQQFAKEERVGVQG
ncbi:hypothetical protein GHA01_28210 [Novacetimonas hansenii]|uniref:Exonuclease domain-containing protein n=4 Tax=Acetobacteraceae TaxID=433 RepID=A0ABQ0SHZ5_NOVHA|nr:hypothetical protein Gaha_0018_002 [Novacetimonas hansenii JCM 7643]GBQ55423.1 hypothetical protein AA0243_0903 [Novacetimonas hansenii NRIC 0243]GEC64972.1 hypothetical protein GHA01_28210 [Novacetimonas hansenii]